MALVLKESKTYNPSVSAQYGVDMTGSNYYGVIDRIEYNKQDKQCNFAVEVYGSAALRESNGTIVDRILFNYNGAGFESDIGKNGLTVPEAYTKAIETLTDWQSDE